MQKTQPMPESYERLYREIFGKPADWEQELKLNRRRLKKNLERRVGYKGE